MNRVSQTDWHTLDERVIFPADDYAQTIDGHKQVIRGEEYFPEVIQDLAEVVCELADQTMNTAVIRRNRNDDEFDSGMYTFHTESPAYAGKIALVTLQGRAILELHEDDVVRSQPCYAGRVLILGAATPHRLIPQLSDQERRFVFFGNAVSQ